MITTRYALRRTDGVWIEAGNTAERARELWVLFGGTVYDCVMVAGGAKWVSVAPSRLSAMTRNHEIYGRALAAGAR